MGEYILEKEQKLVSTLTCYILMFPALTSTINNIMLALFGITTSLDNIILYGVLLVLFIKNMINKKSSTRTKTFMFVTLLFLLLFYTMAFFPSNLEHFWTTANDVQNPLYVFVFLTISGFFVALQVKDADIFLNEAEKWSIAVVILSALQYIITHIKKIDDPQYMVFSYNMLLATTILFLLAFREPKAKRWIFAIIGLAFIFVAGSRGALVSLLISIFVYLFFFSGFDTSKRTFILILGILVVSIFFLQMNNMLSLLAKVLDGLNIESRTIEMALEESFTNDSGRFELQQKVLEKVNIFGYGFFGDRYILEGRYVHNLFLELLCDFGIIVGSFLSIAYVVIVFKALRRADNKWKLLLCALLSVGCFKMMFSGSFLNQEPGLYVLIGLCMNDNIFEKKEKVKSIYIRG